MIVRLLIVVWLVIGALPHAATAAIAKYKSTQGTETRITPRWLYEGDALTPDQMNALIAELKAVELKIDVSAHTGRQVRIYLQLPLVVKGLRGAHGLRVEWATRGHLLSGSVVPGNRTLIFHGTVMTREISDVFDFSLFIDSRQFQGGLGFDPVFEIEESLK